MTQSYQSIGQLSPDAETVAAERKGWQGAAAEEPIQQLTAPDISFWNRRANRQALASTGDGSYAEDFFTPMNDPSDTPPLAGYGMGNGSYDQMPSVGIAVTSFPQTSSRNPEVIGG